MSQSISSKSNSFRLPAQTESALARVGGLMLALPRALRRTWVRHREERLLQDLSDHQLRDVGLRREQISFVLRDGWDR